MLSQAALTAVPVSPQIVCYIYFTRIIAFLLKLAVPFQWKWLYQVRHRGPQPRAPTRDQVGVLGCDFRQSQTYLGVTPETSISSHLP